MFDSNNTLGLSDLRELDEIQYALMSVRSRLVRFISANPQLSWHDVGFISDVDAQAECAERKLSAVCSMLRNRVYAAPSGSRDAAKFDVEYDF